MWWGGVSLCVEVSSQIRDVNILILPLYNGSNIVHNSGAIWDKQSQKLCFSLDRFNIVHGVEPNKKIENI